MLAIVFVMHHPVGHGRDAAALIASINRQATLDRLVHGGLSILYGLLTVGMLLFASRLGLWRPPVLVGVVAFGAALVLVLQAVMIDGFIAPDLAARCVRSSDPTCAAQVLSLLRFGALQIEVSTRFALFAIAVAVFAWSIALLQISLIPRWTGVVGLASSALQLTALFATREWLTPSSLIIILLAEAIWYLLTAYLMITRPGPFADLHGGAQ